MAKKCHGCQELRCLWKVSKWVVRTISLLICRFSGFLPLSIKLTTSSHLKDHCYILGAVVGSQNNRDSGLCWVPFTLGETKNISLCDQELHVFIWPTSEIHRGYYQLFPPNPIYRTLTWKPLDSISLANHPTGEDKARSSLLSTCSSKKKEKRWIGTISGSPEGNVRNAPWNLFLPITSLPVPNRNEDDIWTYTESKVLKVLGKCQKFISFLSVPLKTLRIRDYQKLPS